VTTGPKPHGAARRRVAPNQEHAAPGTAAPGTLDEFMALALLMENEAAQRYSELADAMETHNNRDVAELFRRMAAIEAKHAQKIMAEMKWRNAPAVPIGLQSWAGFESPETTPSEDVHYLMQPYQALQLALAGEQRAEQFFARLVTVAKVATVRKAARELRDEEREHVALVKAWMQKVPKPATNWADDPDPPRYTD
jgi:rubrerythrin